MKSTLGDLVITTKQAQWLEIEPYRQISPHLENCCLRLSAVVSYKKAERAVAYQTGIRVPAKTQERLVHRQHFPTPVIEHPIAEVCVDGGKVRLRTPLGEPSEWRDYKAIETGQGMVANFRNNTQLVDWVNQQPASDPLTCLGDGHDGVWNIVAQLASAPHRREILDGYHLKENLYKVGGSLKRLKRSSGPGRLTPPSRCSTTVHENRPRTSVGTCASIGTGLFIMPIFKLKTFAPLARVPLNRPSSRSTNVFT
jgi:hypothetical protein